MTDPHHDIARESRILRDRFAARQDLIDRSVAHPAFKTARQLVKVVDLGNMPSQPDFYYACNPCEADGQESEGATPSFVCDDGTVMAVDFIRGAPAAGDYAIAKAVGGRWVAEMGGDKATICVLDCQLRPIPGAVVTVLDGSGHAVASCTAGAGGCCKVSVSSGTYTVEAATPTGTIIIRDMALKPGRTSIVAASCCVKVCVTLCGASVPASCPATVTVKDGSGDTVFAGRTDADGCVAPTLTGPGDGPYIAYLSDLPPSYTPATAGYPIDCAAGTVTINVPPTDPTAVCCNPPTPIPRSLTLTDANGGHAFTFCTDGSGNGAWSCCYTISIAPAMDQACSAYDQTSPVAIFYSGNCAVDPADGVTKFSVARSWQSISVNTLNGVKNNYMWTQCGTLNGCPALFPHCGSTADSAAAYLPMDPCKAFAVSGVLTPAGLNIMPDPVGGTVAIS